ncbi:hypothetical protein MSAN_00756900 [Mycena sanguinolenta]|uniref:DUF6534 domain-containing protein n=1 Tax=Mycena sanguinolenta TaxID=230812 RepID=A0A8H6Z2S1_9AGAR|nr:hypothetical protein MSAN_00756900 [Mycena sanguinolenta]
MSSLGPTLGAIEIGAIFSTLFFGISTMQAYNYYRDYPKDRLTLKVLVIGIWSLELLHSALLWHTIYSLTVTFYGEPQHFESPPQTFYFTLLLSALITVIVQFFFCDRIRVFSGKALFPLICCAMSVLFFTGTLASVVLLYIKNSLVVVNTHRWLLTAIFIVTTVTDVAIAISMCYSLGRVRNSEFPKTRNIVDTLIIWCIESAVAKSVASVLQLVLFETNANALWWMIFLLPKASLFSNSMLAALNDRNRLFNGATEDPPPFITFNSNSTQTPSRPSRNVVIQMTRMTETRIDDRDDSMETKAEIEALNMKNAAECR